MERRKRARISAILPTVDEPFNDFSQRLILLLSLVLKEQGLCLVESAVLMESCP